MVSRVRSAETRFHDLGRMPTRLVSVLMKAAPAMGLSLALAGCGDTSIGSTFMNWMPGTKPVADAPATPGTVSPKFAAHAVCPNAEIRFGTETANIYEAGKPQTPDTLKFQMSVQRVARDCDEVGTNIIARVGAAGRVVAGPKGSAGKVDIPVRIAAVSGEKVVYSGLKVVSVQVEAPDFGANWSLVDEAVTIPIDVSDDTIIYVGLDDKSKQAPKEDKPRVHRPKPPAADPNDPYPQMKPNIQ